VLLRGHRSRRPDLHRRLQHGVRAPIVFRRIEEARAKNPALKVIVVDPRATVTARAADLHLAIKPGTDVALFNSMLHVMARDGLLNQDYIRDHTEGFAVPAWTPEVCEVPVESIVTAARMFGNAKAVLSLYCQGLNQSINGTYKNSALINLHLATGQIGRPGAGPFSLTGQPNAMGGREVGGMANLLSGHRDLASKKDREEVAALWGVPSVPERPGKTAIELFDSLGKEVRMVWIACTNPAQSMPDVTAVRRALSKAEFVVVQEAWLDAETCDYADVLLPAATWAEKEGTVTNSERRISRVRAAVPPPGEARPDWQIAVEFARRLGGGKLFRTKKRKTCSTSIARRPADAISISRGCHTRSWRHVGRSSGRSSKKGASVSTKTASSRPRLAARGSSPPSTCRPPRLPTPISPCA
jgi:assimilatory nitrate reductase catalytic subunit